MALSYHADDAPRKLQLCIRGAAPVFLGHADALQSDK